MLPPLGIAEQLVPPSFFIFSILYDFVLPRFYTLCCSTHRSSSLLSLLCVLFPPYNINIYISEEIYELLLLIGFELRLLLMQSVREICSVLVVLDPGSLLNLKPAMIVAGRLPSAHLLLDNLWSLRERSTVRLNRLLPLQHRRFPLYVFCALNVRGRGSRRVIRPVIAVVDEL